MRRLALFIATFGYVGYVPVAPGTFGSAAGLAVFFAVRATGSTAVEVVMILALFAVGIWSGTVAEHHFGGTDPGPIVLDEVVGMLLTLFLLPVTLRGALVGFAVWFPVALPSSVVLVRASGGGGGTCGGTSTT